MSAQRCTFVLVITLLVVGGAAVAGAQPVPPLGYVLEPVATGLGDASRIAIAPSGFGAFGGQVFAARPSSDEVLRIDPTTGSVSSFATTIGTTGFFVEFGTGGAFGVDLYVANSVDPASPTEGLVERIDASGVSTVFGNPTPPPGPPSYQFGGVGMAFSDGGAFGTFLYSGTGGGQISDSLSTLPSTGGSSALFADFGSVLNGTPTELRFGSGLLGFGTDLYVGLNVVSGGTGVETGIYRYDSAGGRTPFSLASADPEFTGVPSGLAFAELGAFEGALYACVNGDAIVRIDDTGDVERFVESIGSCSSLAFSEDGQTLYFIDSTTGTLWALRRMPTPNVSVGDFVVFEEDFRGEFTYPTNPEANELGFGGMTPSGAPFGAGPDVDGRTVTYQVDGASGEISQLVETDGGPLADGSFMIRTRASGLSSPVLSGVALVASQGGVFAAGVEDVSLAAQVEFTWDGMGTPQGELQVVERRFPSGPEFESVEPLTAPVVAALLDGAAFDLELDVTRGEGIGSATAALRLDSGATATTAPLAFSIVSTESFLWVRHAFGLDGPSPEVVALDLTSFEVLQPFVNSFAVDSTIDAVDTLPGDGFCSTTAAECTLRAALQEANALAGSTEIVLGAGTHTLSIPGDDEDASATGDLDVLDDVAIRGAGPGTTIIDAASIDRVVHNPSNPISQPTLRLEGVTLTGGQADDGNDPSGGGVLSVGRLFLADCVVAGNRANFGGGIVSGSRLSMKRCVVENNEAIDYFVDSSGGGIRVPTAISSAARAHFFDSAIVSNFADVDAGLECTGFPLAGSSNRVWLENTTVSGNEDAVAGEQISLSNCTGTLLHSTVVGGSGSGLSASRSVTSTAALRLVNSVFSGTPACEPFSTLTPTLEGNNASEDTSCGFTGLSDIVGVSLDLAPLAALDTNGGLLASTRGHLPNPGSPLIEAADEDACTRFDQRRGLRPVDGDTNGTPLCDLGAIEVPEPGFAIGLCAGVMALGTLRRRSLARLDGGT
ncbi:MAG: SMP-30/gluconolactonase/LRE family protein [bacterium]|nr:SMP-30/gluconolactonase/LRE family protein [bacterium]